MDCNQFEEQISLYIEGDLPGEQRLEMESHLAQCPGCRNLKNKVEELMGSFSQLEEEVPFFLKNRLLYIPESKIVENDHEGRFAYMKWVAAVVGTFVLLLNLFYFTNIYPPANRTLHNMVSQVKTFTVETIAFFEKVKDSKGMALASLFKPERANTDTGMDSFIKFDDDEMNDNKIEIDQHFNFNGGK